jgi:osmotically-inducible protein OsmY
MSQEQWQSFQQPQHYRMDFDRNQQSYEHGERSGRGFGYRGNSVYDRDNSSSAEDMGFRSASSDMPSADRFRTRGFDDDGPGLYGGAEDYGHAGYQERFDYGANRYPNAETNRGGMYQGQSGTSDGGAGAAWSYERAEQWNRQGNRSGSNYGSANGNVNGSSNGYGDSSNYGGSGSNRNASYSSGPHRGKGPKNYNRSDDRIREDVCERLMQDAEIDASEIEVKVSSGEVTLSGTVSSKDEKRQAEDCIENLSGVKDVHNELRVESSNLNRSASTTNSSSNTENSTNGQSSRSNSRSTARVS